MASGTDYRAGNLELIVQTISDKALNSLDRLNAELSTTMSLLGSTSSIIKNLGSTTGRSGRASSFEKEYKTIQNGQLKSLTTIKKTDDAVQKITKAYNQQGKAIRETITNIDKLGNKTTEILDKGKKNDIKMPSSFKLTDLFNKVYFLRNYTKQMFLSMKRVLNYAVEYTETLNLWQVAMRNNREEADEFVNTMNKAYGISTQTLMNYQAIFRNMLSSLGGVSEGTSYALSEFLTQMAIDYASLYNTSIERAMTTFQSVLSGQVRPIRSIAGYDITETTIFQLYQQLGGTKTMRQLTQTEKRLLRIYAVFQQMESSGAIGDLNRTLGNTANQMRIMSEASKELQTWFGLIMEDIFKPALPRINAFLITLTNITKAIAKMRGVKLFEGGAVESVEDLNAELDETQGKLLSFDRFEALNSSEGESNLLGIDENLLAGLSQYSSILSEVTGKAQELAKKWTSWFVDIDTGELTESGKTLISVLEKIGIVLGSLIGFNLIKRIGKLFLGVKSVGGAIRYIGLAISALNIIDIIKNWNNWTSSAKTLAGGILALTAVFASLAVAIYAASKQWGKAIAVGSTILATGTSVALGVGNLVKFEKGGQVEDGVFTMNKGEIIGNFDDGTTVVANNQQIIAGIQQGVYTAVASAMRQSGGAGIGDVILDGRKVGYTTAKYSHQENVRSGYVRATR